MAEKSFSMRLSKEDQKLMKEQAKREDRTVTQQVLWLFREREKQLLKDQ